MIDDSKFQMWRGTIALVQVDNIISNEERKWLDDHLKKLPFNEEQKQTLKDDFANGITLDEVLPRIKENRERGILMNFANTIFKADGLVHEEEQVLDGLREKIMGKLDFTEICKDLGNIQKDFERKKESESSIQQVFNYLFSKF